jgi:cytochrome c oxidase cbb3-type subunit III
MNKPHVERWRLLPLLAVLAAGCDLPGKPSEADRPVPANEVKDFDALYSMRCAGCHGADGKLGPAPPLNDPLFLAIVPDAELLRVITEGRSVTREQKTPMPAFAHDRGGPLTGAQVKVLAEGIKKRWGPPAPPSGSLPPYLGNLPVLRASTVGLMASPLGQGPLLAASALFPGRTYLGLTGGPGGNDEGAKRVFARACAGCHGPQGQGEKDGRSLPGGAINSQAFLALISDQALRRLIITGRPDLGMPAYDGKDGRPPEFRPLTSAEIDELVALLKDWRQGGAYDDK